jgi:V8-like Glu-specific endopeptidase
VVTSFSTQDYLKGRQLLKYLILSLLITSRLFAAVTGEDDRISFKDLERINPAKMATATATQLSRRYIKKEMDMISYPTGKLQNQCPGEKFANEPTLGGCSGFLIGENILVAAGHCKDYQANGCQDDAWLFKHFLKASDKRQVLKKSNIYYCKKVLDFKHDGEGDFVVIELDRKVLGVRPLEMDLKDQGQKGDPVAVLGYPLGRSFTYTPGGRILSKDKNYLRIDSDAFKNNSGSALVNLRTGKVEGILTNAKKGMSHNLLDGCQLAKSYKKNIVLVNRLRRISYLDQNYKFSQNKKNRSFINNCKGPILLSLKYRQEISNDWVTQSKLLIPNQELTINDIKSNKAFLNAQGQSGKSIVRGSDFWGFIDHSREVELGFKKVSLTEAHMICPK